MLSALRQDNSPFTHQQIEALQHGLDQIDATQAAWLSGYLAGQLAGRAGQADPVASAGTAATPLSELKIFYGSQTGTGESIAEQLGAAASAEGISASVQSLADLRPAALKKVRQAVFVISTHGEGDPPDDALDLFEFLQRSNAPGLEKLRFRVLALGDSSYAQYCEAGRKLEQLLLARGATAFAERVDVDLDYEKPAARWADEVLDYARAEIKPAGNPARARETTGAPQGVLSVVPAATPWQRRHPFPATVSRTQKINAAGSGKDVYHIELSIEDSGIRYQPGDSLGVWAYNDPQLVDAVLSGLGIDGSEQVPFEDGRVQISNLLVRCKELTRLNPDTLAAYAEKTADPGLPERLNAMDADKRQQFIEQRQFIDLVEEYPADMQAAELAAMLKPLAPRSYSIASSQAVADDEVHLTVASVHSNAIGRSRSGVASGFLNQRLQAGDEVGVFLEPNKRFHLPENPDAPLILVAAGTGIAPYRAFLQQLEEQSARRDVWLVFGNRHLRTDFLYQREWLRWRSQGLLSRIDCAFSRDQQDKRYVQHVIEEQSESVGEWLDRGAHVYICGALSMGHQVETALKSCLARRYGLDGEGADEALSNLRRERRLSKDLY